ncbi:MAG TPA: YdeI/OmpD-associated family protein [Anaerolineales bacterium]|nr:YdeI/OmpD-associated family protein [Anaerolineales bacterium]
MPNKHTFTAVIQNAGGGGAFVEIPFDVEKAFGSKRPKVKAMIEGVSYRGTLTRMGTERHLLIILKEIREKIGKTVDDEVKITVELDTEPRVVEIPPELANAFKKEKTARDYFNSLSYSHQREYVGYITEAKKEETRARRAAQTIEMLKKQMKGG